MPATPAITADSIFVERARELKPKLAARREECLQLRRMPDATCRDLLDAGLFRLFQPARYGGHEVDPMDFFDVQLELSAACPSTGWTWGVLSAHAWQLGLFPQQAQEDVWGRQPTALLASSYAPLGKQVEPVDGGFIIAGKWDFCSGVDHVAWCLLGGLVPGERQEYRTFLVPRSECEIEDRWHVSGLQGTGSKSVIVNGAFVPEHRTHRMKDGFSGDNPGQRANTAPLYRIPFGQVFIRSISTPALGMAWGAFESCLELVRAKISTVSGQRAAEDPRVLEALADARVQLEGMRAKMKANFAELRSGLDAGQPLSLERRVQFKYESADVVRRCCEVLDALMAAAGAMGIFRSNALAQFQCDAIAARAHFGNNAPFFARNFGSMLLGRGTSDPFL